MKNIKKHNGDAGHEHNLVVKDNATGQNLYQTGEFTEFEARNQTFNEVGEYTMKIQRSGAERILVLWGISNTDLCKYTSSIKRYPKNFRIANPTIPFLFPLI
jgi:hypothetical protein